MDTSSQKLTYIDFVSQKLSEGKTMTEAAFQWEKLKDQLLIEDSPSNKKKRKEYQKKQKKKKNQKEKTHKLSKVLFLNSGSINKYESSRKYQKELNTGEISFTPVKVIKTELKKESNGWFNSGLMMEVDNPNTPTVKFGSGLEVPLCRTFLIRNIPKSIEKEQIIEKLPFNVIDSKKESFLEKNTYSLRCGVMCEDMTKMAKELLDGSLLLSKETINPNSSVPPINVRCGSCDYDKRSNVLYSPIKSLQYVLSKMEKKGNLNDLEDNSITEVDINIFIDGVFCVWFDTDVVPLILIDSKCNLFKNGSSDVFPLFIGRSKELILSRAYATEISLTIIALLDEGKEGIPIKLSNGKTMILKFVNKCTLDGGDQKSIKETCGKSTTEYVNGMINRSKSIFGIEIPSFYPKPLNLEEKSHFNNEYNKFVFSEVMKRSALPKSHYNSITKVGSKKFFGLKRFHSMLQEIEN